MSDEEAERVSNQAQVEDPAEVAGEPEEIAAGDEQEFVGRRELLIGVAYRVLGSVADAEDVVQDAWLRWSTADRARVADPRAYLVTVTTRLAIDRLRRRQSRQEAYVGEWLPEVLVTGPDLTPELADSVSMAMLVVLETLSPVERAVYVLREAFGFEHAEIARIVERSPVAVRQIARRAREHVRARRPRFATDPEARRRATETFVTAAAGGDFGALMAVLAPDVVMHSDTGGRTPGPLRPIVGAEKVARLFAATVERIPVGSTLHRVELNAGPGAIFAAGGQAYGVFVVQVDPDSGLITDIQVHSNPAKLGGVGAELRPPAEGGWRYDRTGREIRPQ